jgi:acetyltransferase-like isoleucine patch superfamily enzyme
MMVEKESAGWTRVVRSVDRRRRRARKRFRALVRDLTSRAALIAASVEGVHVGRSCRFYGVPRFERAHGSVIEIGDGCTLRSARWSNPAGINRPCRLTTVTEGASLRIGDRTGLSGVVIACAQEITVGEGCILGANVTITDTDWHGVAPEERREFGQTAPVHIEDRVFLGLNVTVLKGVTIGHDSVIGAGSVVAQSIPPLSVAVGSPARVVKNLQNDSR